MKKLILLPLLCLGLTACGYKDPMTADTITYNVLNYKSLSIYSYGTQVDSWYTATGVSSNGNAIARWINAHSVCNLTVKNNYITIEGSYEYPPYKGSYTIIYGGEGYSYTLAK